MGSHNPDAGTAGIVATLRTQIIDGRLLPGTRMAESAVAAEFGVSRTPVRLAFRTLEQEGLLQRIGSRTLVVRAFSDADVLCAVEVRGVLEGLAARRLAERGMSAAVRDELQACIDAGKAVLARGHLEPADLAAWSALNHRFHHTIVGATDSQVIADAVARNNHLPFASADSIAVDTDALPAAYQRLRLAHLQHELVFEALQRRESARVEMLMREHAYIGLRYGALLEAVAAPTAAARPREATAAGALS